MISHLDDWHYIVAGNRATLKQIDRALLLLKRSNDARDATIWRRLFATRPQTPRRTAT